MQPEWKSRESFAVFGNPLWAVGVQPHHRPTAGVSARWRDDRTAHVKVPQLAAVVIGELL